MRENEVRFRETAEEYEEGRGRGEKQYWIAGVIS